MNRKTIEAKILTAVTRDNETSPDCGLPFRDRKDELARQMGELAENIYNAVVGFAEKAAEIAYGRRK